MTTIQIIHLIAMTMVFVVWCFFMFRMLWILNRRSRDKLAETGGGYFTWVGHSLRSFGDAATSRQDKTPRRKLICLTLVLMALVVLSPVVANLGR